MRAGRQLKKNVLFILQGLPLSLDRRAWDEALSLTKNGYRVSVISPAASGEPRHDCVDSVDVYRYRPAPQISGKLGYIVEDVYSFLATFYLSLVIRARNRFDIIQAANPPDTFFVIARFYKLLSRTAFVFDDRDVSPEIYCVRFAHNERLIGAPDIAVAGAVFLQSGGCCLGRQRVLEDHFG